LGKRPVRHEIRQGIKDAPLEHHPETGEPIRRVPAAGVGVITRGKARPSAPCGASAAAAARCGGAGCCHR